MKKYISLILAVVISLMCFTSCKSKPTDNNSSNYKQSGKYIKSNDSSSDNQSDESNNTNSSVDQNTRVERVEPTCLSEGYEKVYSADSGKLISEKTLPKSEEHKPVIITTAEASEKMLSNRDPSDDELASKYALLQSDWEVAVCSECGMIYTSSLNFAYNPVEAAEIMLGYVNQLREEVYGTNEYDLVIHDYLIHLSVKRAGELDSNYSHDTDTCTFAVENIGNVHTIKEYFEAWKASPDDYKNMIDKNMKYFGFAMSNDYSNVGDVYGVQLFWDYNQHDKYIDYLRNK